MKWWEGGRERVRKGRGAEGGKSGDEGKKEGGRETGWAEEGRDVERE